MLLKKPNKKGFTLIELLVTIILLGIIGVIVIYNMTNVSNTSKETEYERYIATVKSAADVYADLNPQAFNDLKVNKAFLYIKVEELIKNGLLDEELVNPYTEKRIGLEELIKANLDGESGAVTFEFPVEEPDKETFLVAISDYVVWGEPYDCMQGAGSYELALSEEDGELIMVNDDATREKYNFQCTFPSEFKEYQDRDGNVIGKATEEAGSYDITYTWVTSSGTRKSATRTLRVLPKVRPTFKTNYTYDLNAENYESASWFTPEYNETTKKWKWLTYTPYIEGGDPDTTTFHITKRNNLIPGSTAVNVTSGFTNTYEEYEVDDGSKTYFIDTVVIGHHNKDYSYSAKGKAIMNSKLVLPASFIAGGSTKWTTDKTYTISTPKSPVGVQSYEFRLANSAGEAKNGDSEISRYVFTKNTENVSTQKNVNIYDEGCQNKDLSKKQIYFRAKNKEGYIGDWSPVKNAYITNSIQLLLQADSSGCANASQCCLGTNGCYYTAKKKFINLRGQLFVVLERYRGGQILAALATPTACNTTGISTSWRTWSLQTCDGIFSKTYEHASPAIGNIATASNSIGKLIPGYSKYLNYVSWPGGVGNSYFGAITENDFKKYGAALHGSTYWTVTQHHVAQEIYVDTPYAHGNHTTIYNSYTKVVSGTGIIDQYNGNRACVKPIVQMKETVYSCSGNGSSAHPYVVANK